MDIHVVKTKIPVNPDALEEIEGRYMEFMRAKALAEGREPDPDELMPDAHRSMALYAIEFGQCPMCGWKPAERIRSKERDVNIAIHVEKCFPPPQI